MGRLFWARVFSVCFIYGVLEDFRGWIRGCACHEEDRKAGRPVNCTLAGRRARHLWNRVQLLICDLRNLLVSMAWLAEDWYAEFQGELKESIHECITAMIGIVTIKFAFLDRFPYLLLRLREPGVARRCLDMYDELVARGVSTIHRISCFFCHQMAICAAT